MCYLAYYVTMDSTSKRRLVENELIFKKKNQRIKAGIKKLIAQSGINEFTTELYCECSNEDCSDKIVINTKDYDRVHKNAKHFIVKCGHEVKEVETVLERTKHYCVVEKFIAPPSTTNMKLNKT